jgi:hypothetical protein
VAAAAAEAAASEAEAAAAGILQLKNLTLIYLSVTSTTHKFL